MTNMLPCHAKQDRQWPGQDSSRRGSAEWGNASCSRQRPLAALLRTTGRHGGHFTLNLILCANISLSMITNNWLRISRAQGCHQPMLVLHFQLRIVSDDGRVGSIPRCIICIIYRHLLKLSPAHKCISSLVLVCCILFTHSIEHLARRDGSTWKEILWYVKCTQ